MFQNLKIPGIFFFALIPLKVVSTFAFMCGLCFHFVHAFLLFDILKFIYIFSVCLCYC